jgi:tyrosinase
MMKKLLLLSAAVFCGIVITSFVNKKAHLKSTGAAVEGNASLLCTVPAANAALFLPAPAAVMVRKNVYNLSAAEITSLKNGIAAMKALPLTNTTSWQYQAAIHGTTLGNNLPSWNSCQHGTQFFFSWHRMYLYFFERILRAKSGDPHLTLPYWDYQSNPVLPPDYRNSAATNTLYDGSRSPSINGGGALGPGIMTAINTSLTNIPFFDFQSAIEGPHGSVHVAIGGNMGSVPTAALDPCFWLHHTNIDRLWEVWLRKCGGRSNPPAGDPWMKQIYTFYDEKGNAVNMTGSQVLSTAASLNYRYDLKPTLRCDLKLKWWIWKWKWWELLRLPNPVIINKPLVKFSFREAPQDNLKRFIEETKTTKFNFASSGQADKLFLQLEDVKAEKLPEGVVEIYLNLKPGEAPNPKSRSFAGVLDLFTMTGHTAHITADKQSLRINISAAARSLGLLPADLAKAEISFFVRGNTFRQKEISTSANIQAGAITLGIEKAVAEK